MSTETPAERYKVWQREWATFRREYTETHSPAPIVAPVSASPTDGWRWECPQCDEGNNANTRHLAETRGRGHTQMHIPAEIYEKLEDHKVRMMPEEFLSPTQKARKEEL